MPAPIVVEHKKYQYGISCYYMLLASFNFVKYSLAVGPSNFGSKQLLLFHFPNFMRV